MTDAASPKTTTISRGAYQLFVGNLVSTVVLAVTLIIVARLLGPGNYGLYTIALIVPTYVYLLIQLGLPSTATRFSAKYLSEGQEQKAISFSYTISVLHLAGGLLVVVLLIPFTNVISTDLLHRPDLSTGFIIPIALLSVIGQILSGDVSAAFVGLHRFGKSALFQVINALGKLVLSVSLVLLGYAVAGAVIGYTFGYVIAGVISILLLISLNKKLIPANIREIARTSTGYTLPIYFATILSSIVAPFQSTILAHIVSNSQIGWYAAAVNIGTLITLFSYPVGIVVFPLFSRTVPNGEEGIRQLADLFKLSVKYAALFIVPVACLVMVLSTPLTIAIYGHAYGSAGNYLVIVAIVSLLSGAGSLSDTQFLYGVGETRKALLATAIGAVVSIVASLLLVYWIGVYGILVGTVLGQIISLYFNLLFIAEILGAKPQNWFFWRIYVASAVSSLVVYPVSLLGLNQYLTVVIGGALFLLILIPVMTWTKALTRNDMSGLQGQFKGVREMTIFLNIVSKYQNFFLSFHKNTSD